MNEPLSIHNSEVFAQGFYGNKPLLFIHGNSLNARTFINQFQELQAIPLLAVNLPGHGGSFRSDTPENDYNLHGFVRTIKNIINHLGISEFVIAGHSLGGNVAIECMAEIEELKGVCIFGTAPAGIPTEMSAMFLPNAHLDKLFQAQLSETDAMLLAEELLLRSSPALGQYKEYILQTDQQFRSYMGLSVSQGKLNDEIELINNSKIPVAIVHGTQDRIINSEYFSRLTHTRLWGDKVHYIPEAGHSPHLESSEAFNRLIAAFYNSVFTSHE